MQLPFELIVGWRYTRASKRSRRNGFISFISMVSMLGISLGVAALIIVLSVMNGFQKEVRDRMLGVVAHIEVMTPDASGIQNPALTMKEISSHPEVKGVAPFIAAQALMARGEEMRGVMVRGIDPLLEPTVSDLGVQQQKVQDSVLKLLKPNEFSIVLGYALANQLGVQLNDKVTLMLPGGQLTPAGTLPRMKQLTVVGVFDSGHYEFDSSLAMIHLEDAQKLYRVDGPTGIRVKLNNLHLARDFAPVLEASLSGGLVARDWTRQNKSWFAAVQVEKRMMSIILTLIVAVAAFNLVSTLVMTVTDKTSDIAILRTLGSSPKSIMAIFVVQGAVIGVVGTAIGLLLGLLVAFNVGTLVSIIEGLFQVSFLPRDIYLLSRMPSDPLFADIFPVVIISLVLAFIATLYPSWRASRLNPAHALRYD